MRGVATLERSGRGSSEFGTEVHPLRRRQVVKARTFVAPRLLDQHEVGRVTESDDPTGRGHRHDQVTPRCVQLRGDDDGRGGADSARHDPYLAVTTRRDPQLGVVAGPIIVTNGLTRGGEVSDDVAVRIQQTHVRHRCLAEMPLSTRFAQQPVDPEHRRLVMLLRPEDGRQVVGHADKRFRLR